MVPIVIRVIFRVFLLTENGNKNSNFHWVSKLSLDEQTFRNTTKILRVTITTRYLNSPSAKTFSPLYPFFNLGWRIYTFIMHVFQFHVHILETFKNFPC